MPKGSDNNKYNSLILEAFYPKEIENDLVTFIKKYLNTNFQLLNN